MPPPAPSASVAATPPSPSAPPVDLVEVARITDAYGVQGWIRLAPHESAADSLLLGAARCWIGHPSGTPPQCCEIAAIRTQGAALVMRLATVGDRDAALAFKGGAVFLSRAQFPAPAPGEYYWVDLIGCTVAAPDGSALGAVAAVDDNGAHAILRVLDGEGEVLIPFVAAYIVAVDLAARQIVADWQRDW